MGIEHIYNWNGLLIKLFNMPEQLVGKIQSKIHFNPLGFTIWILSLIILWLGPTIILAPIIFVLSLIDYLIMGLNNRLIRMLSKDDDNHTAVVLFISLFLMIPLLFTYCLPKILYEGHRDTKQDKIKTPVRSTDITIVKRMLPHNFKDGINK